MAEVGLHFGPGVPIKRLAPAGADDVEHGGPFLVLAQERVHAGVPGGALEMHQAGLVEGPGSAFGERPGSGTLSLVLLGRLAVHRLPQQVIVVCPHGRPSG